MYHFIQDGFFYTCYAVTALVLLHRMLVPAPAAVVPVAVPEPIRVEPTPIIKPVSRPVPAAAKAIASTATLAIAVEPETEEKPEYSISLSQMYALAKEHKVPNYKKVKREVLYGRLKVVGAVE